MSVEWSMIALNAASCSFVRRNIGPIRRKSAARCSSNVSGYTSSSGKGSRGTSAGRGGASDVVGVAEGVFVAEVEGVGSADDAELGAELGVDVAGDFSSLEAGLQPQTPKIKGRTMAARREGQTTCECMGRNVAAG